MSTRLIVTYEEAKALKEAGYPQWPDIPHGKPAGFWQHRPYGENKIDPFKRTRLRGWHMVTTPQGDGEFADAARLDQLLAFLWESDYNVDIQLGEDDEGYRGWFCFLYPCWYREMLHEAQGDDGLSALVNAVLHVLDREREAL